MPPGAVAMSGSSVCRGFWSVRSSGFIETTRHQLELGGLWWLYVRQYFTRVVPWSVVVLVVGVTGQGPGAMD